MTTPATHAGSLNRPTRMSAIDIDLRGRKKPKRTQTRDVRELEIDANVALLAATPPNPKSAQTVLGLAWKCRRPASAALVARAAPGANKADGGREDMRGASVAPERAAPDRSKGRMCRNRPVPAMSTISPRSGCNCPPCIASPGNGFAARRGASASRIPLEFCRDHVIRTHREAGFSVTSRTPGSHPARPKCQEQHKWPSSKHGTWSNGLGP
jgi:hypothetical protein